MNFVSRGVALLALFGAASCALAQGTITFQYIVPNNGVWPPTTFTPAGGWNTVSSGNIGITTPGLQIPGIEQAYDIAGVPLSLRGGLTQVLYAVDGFTRLAYAIDNGSTNQAINSLTHTGTLTVKAPVTSPPGSSGANILTVVSSATEPLSVAASSGDDPFNGDFLGADFAEGTITAQGSTTTGTYTSGATFNAFNSAGLVYLPIGLLVMQTTGSGNYAIDGNTFGAARVTVTYTYLPESQLAWVGLPLVLGGWLVRRKLTAVTVKL